MSLSSEITDMVKKAVSDQLTCSPGDVTIQDHKFTQLMGGSNYVVNAKANGETYSVKVARMEGLAPEHAASMTYQVKDVKKC